jgi:hypothetical protein
MKEGGEKGNGERQCNKKKVKKRRDEKWCGETEGSKKTKAAKRKEVKKRRREVTGSDAEVSKRPGGWKNNRERNIP